MKAVEASRDNLWVSARALMAYRSGKRGALALAGAFLEAEHFSIVRSSMIKV